MDHGLRARFGPAGFHVDGPRDGAASVVIDVVEAGESVGAAYGLVGRSEAQSIVRALARGADPAGPDTPWVAVARVGRSGLAAAASTMMGSGVAWSTRGGELVVATDPVAASGPGRVVLADYVRAFASGDVPPDVTPFAGVKRIPPGRTAMWASADATPRVSVWCGPEVWRNPTLEGRAAIEAFRGAFDEAVSGVARRVGPLVSTVSGGLDSSFVAASLAASAAPGAPVLGLVYSPLPDALIGPDGQWDPDETGLVEHLARSHNGALIVEPVRNLEQVRPLAAARDAAVCAGVPTFSPANQVWMSAMRSAAADRGAKALFVGTHGNVSFSFEHHDAALYYLRRLRLGRVAGLGLDASGRWSSRTFRTEVLGPLRRRAGAGRPGGPSALARFGLPPATSVGSIDRGSFLQWLARSRSGLGMASNPAAVAGVLNADPFAARAVIEVAASITPAEWQRGGISRGFARRAGEGRVPDVIRLRVRRGQQGRDAWYVVRHDRDDYLDRLSAVAGVPGLEHVDATGLRAHVASWPWGEIEGPSWAEQIAVDRLLALAEFAGVW